MVLSLVIAQFILVDIMIQSLIIYSLYLNTGHSIYCVDEFVKK